MAVTGPQIPIPRHRAQIDWGHPLARGLVAAWVPLEGHIVDLVSGNTLTLRSTAAFDSPTGALRIDATSEGAELTIPTRLNIQQPITIVTYFDQTATQTGSFSYAFGLTANNTDSSPYAIAVLYAGGSAFWELFYSDGTTTGSTNSGILQGVGLWHLIGAWKNGDQRIYVNGLQKAGLGATGYGTITYSGTGTVGFGSLTPVSTRSLNADFYYGLVYNSLFTPEEAAWLYTEPWAWLAPIPPIESLLNVSAGLKMPVAVNSYRQRRGYA